MSETKNLKDTPAPDEWLPPSMRRDAMVALLSNPDFRQAVYRINPLVDSGVDQIPQVLAFLGEMLLQMPCDRFSQSTDDPDIQQGMGWILHFCAEAMTAQTDFDEALRIVAEPIKAVSS